MPRARLFSVCGNLLAFTRDPRLRPAPALAALCWENGSRIADGAVDVRPAGDTVVMRFVNPDGTDDFCGNALLALCEYLEVSRVRVRNGPLEVLAERYGNPVVTICGLRLACRDVPLRGSPVLMVDVGTAHCVIRVDSVRSYALETVGSHVTRELGANLTIFEISRGVAAARTFERGVEAETRGCGTGAVAVQLVRGGDSGDVIFPGGAYSVTVRDRGRRPVISLAVAGDAVTFVRDI